MSLGYEGYVLLDDQLVLATSASAPESRNKIEAQSAYKGTSNAGIGGMGYPHQYDYLSFDGNFSAELAPSLISQLKTWIISGRNTSKSIKIQSRKSGSGNAGMQRIPEAFWTSISFDVSQGSALTSTVDFISWKKYINSSGTTTYNSVSDQYLENKSGLLYDLGMLSAIGAGGSIPILNAASNLSPIPWWKANISGFTGSGTIASPVSWNVSFSQSVEKVFTCSAQSTVQEPAFIAIGPLVGTLSVEIVLLDGSYSVLDSVTGIALTMGTSTFNLGTAQLTSFPDDLKDGSSQTNVQLNYDIYGPLS